MIWKWTYLFIQLFLISPISMIVVFLEYNYDNKSVNFDSLYTIRLVNRFFHQVRIK